MSKLKTETLRFIAQHKAALLKERRGVPIAPKSAVIPGPQSFRDWREALKAKRLQRSRLHSR